LKIDSYSFGEITIAGKRYKSDVIVFPDRVIDGWWRREGHSLHEEDIDAVVGTKPEVLIVGTGYSGMMRVPEKTRRYVESKGIELIATTTGEACKLFNKLSSEKRVVAALHLTC